MVRVLATAHIAPARIAQTTRCGACRTSLPTWETPRRKAGTLHRARKTPKTIMRDTVIGETSGLTSLIGASAPPSHAPAAKPQKIPSACRLRRREAERVLRAGDSITEASGGRVIFNVTGPVEEVRPAVLPTESRSAHQ